MKRFITLCFKVLDPLKKRCEFNQMIVLMDWLITFMFLYSFFTRPTFKLSFSHCTYAKFKRHQLKSLKKRERGTLGHVATKKNNVRS